MTDYLLHLLLQSFRLSGSVTDTESEPSFTFAWVSTRPTVVQSGVTLIFPTRVRRPRRHVWNRPWAPDSKVSGEKASDS